MHQPFELFCAIMSGLACLAWLFLSRYPPLNGWAWARFFAWCAGWSAAVSLSKAFDPMHQMSLRSHVINWAGFALLAVLVMRDWRRSAKAKRPDTPRTP